MSLQNTPPYLLYSVSWHPSAPNEWVLQAGPITEIYSSRGSALVRADDLRRGIETPGIAKDLLR
jgi:hypothetical protein